MKSVSYPDAFYYRSKISEHHYTDSAEGGGELEVDRFLQGLPAFKSASLASQRQPKNLILSDWRLSCWSKQEIKRIIQPLQACLDSGFPIYLWQDNRAAAPEQYSLVRLTKENLVSLESLFPQVSLQSQTFLMRFAYEKYQLLPDKTWVVDDYWLPCLFKHFPHTQKRIRELFVSELVAFQEINKNFQAVVQIARTAHPPLQGIFVDRYFKSADRFVLEIVKEGKICGIRTSYRDLSLDHESCVKLLQKKCIFESFLSFLPDYLPHIKTLELDPQGAVVENFLEIIKITNEIQKLFLRKYHGSMLSCLFQSLGSESLLYLEKLDLSFSDLSGECLYHVLNKTPYLMLLDLFQCKNVEINFRDEPGFFPHLEFLNASGSDISEETVYSLMSRLPSLKELKLYQCEKISSEFLNRLQLQYPHLSIENKAQIGQPIPPDVVEEPVNIPYNADARFHFKPTKDDAAFEFVGKNKTLNQGMILEKLSQYLTIMEKDLEYIPKIQGGICTQLSKIFLRNSQEAWERFISHLYCWDGRRETLNKDLHYYLEMLWSVVKEDRFSKSEESGVFFGDNLKLFLEKHPGDYLLKNVGWHQVAIRYHKDNDSWSFYDPNFVKGVLVGLSLRKLIPLITYSLGHFVLIMEQLAFQEKVVVADYNTFIRQGGLFFLFLAENWEAILAALPRKESDYTAHALQGLLLRGATGVPAWLAALVSNKTAVLHYTLSLLKHFIALYPQDYTAQLSKSLKVVAADQICYCINFLTPKLASVRDPVMAVVCNIVYAARDKATLAGALATWRKTTTEKIDTIAEYCQCLFQGKTKQLVEVLGREALQDLQTHIEYAAHRNASYDLFCVDTPQDLICSLPYLEAVSEEGVIKGVPHKGPGGALYRFLKKYREDNITPILLVNYANFESDDFVRFNKLLEEDASADGVLLPKNTKIIGLIDVKKIGCYQGADFYSRFDVVEKNPLTDSASMPSPFVVVLDGQLNTPFFHRIDLYHAEDWKARLLGRWVIKKENIYFEKGELQKVIQEGIKHIVLANPPEEDESFIRFWQRSLIHGKIHYAGQVFHFPQSLCVSTTEGYPWDALCQGHRASYQVMQSDAVVLNAHTLNHFFHQYACDNTLGLLETQPGWLARFKGKNLPVNLTGELSQDAWGRLLTACQREQVTLVIACAPSVMLPWVISSRWQLVYEEKLMCFQAMSEVNAQKTILIQSNDPGFTVATLQSQKTGIAIEISECSASDLLVRLSGEYGLASGRLLLRFNQKEQALLQSLKSGQSVILYGKFSSFLSDALADFLLSRQALGEAAPGQLILVSQDMKPFSYLKSHQHVIADEDKRLFLEKEGGSSERILSEIADHPNDSYHQYRSRLYYKTLYPDSLSDKAWEGVSHLPSQISLIPFDPQSSERESIDFIRQRLRSVNAVITRLPCVFLTGLTGVGKSSFVEKYVHSPRAEIYRETEMVAWAMDTSDRWKVLFIDEANLSTKSWSELEGLFNKPPGILIRGTYYPLAFSHKVIFAGNPVSDGDERQLAPFFKEHGCAVLFEPLPPSFIYEKIIKPIFENTPLEKEANRLTLPLLAVYRFLCDCDAQTVLISPREIQMMALMTWSAYESCPKTPPLLLANQYAYQLAKPLVPAAHLAEFDRQFLMPNKNIGYTFTKNNFLVTPSRQDLYQQLCDLLSLRHLRRARTTGNEAKRHGGLGGMIIEGEPGMGKSDMVVAVLREQGYEAASVSQGVVGDRCFYQMPVSMALDAKRTLLLKAFDEGAVVIIDEINSSPMMERLLNDLLMGKAPNGQSPKKPGFMVIGTQNPAEEQGNNIMGRRKMSAALARRFMHHRLLAYTSEEMVCILMMKYHLKTSDAEQVVKAYLKQKKWATTQHLNPVPTFRDVLKVVKNRKTEGVATFVPLRRTQRSNATWFSLPANTRKRATPLSFYAPLEKREETVVAPAQASSCPALPAPMKR